MSSLLDSIRWIMSLKSDKKNGSWASSEHNSFHSVVDSDI